MKASEVNPYDTIQVAKIRKRDAAFRHAKRIVNGWPTWKQEVSCYPPVSNAREK